MKEKKKKNECQKPNIDFTFVFPSLSRLFFLSFLFPRCAPRRRTLRA